MVGKVALISGSGNVATHAAEKVTQLGGKVVTLSDSEGFVHDPAGIDQEKINWIKQLKTVKRGRIREYVDQFPGSTFIAGKTPWGVPCDVALPCATQNEILTWTACIISRARKSYMRPARRRMPAASRSPAWK